MLPTPCNPPSRELTPSRGHLELSSRALEESCWRLWRRDLRYSGQVEPQAAQGADAMDHGLALALRCLQPMHANEFLALQSQVAPSQAAPSLAMMCWALALALAWSWALPLALRRLGLPQGCLQPPLATLARAA